jgi:hypothetical protein
MAFQRRNHGRNHSYRDGEAKIPGVTSYLQSLPKPALVGWAAGAVAEFVVDNLATKQGHLLADELEVELRVMAREKEVSFPDKWSRSKAVQLLKGLPNDDRDRAGTRGTEVHRLAHRLAEGAEVDVPEELVGHVDSYLQFRDEWNPTNEIVERPIINRQHVYAGTFDLIADLDHGLGRQLIDIKTSRSGVFGEVALQLAAYRNAEQYLDEDGEEQPMIGVDGCCALWVRADGYDLYPITAGPEEYRVFRYLQQVAIWLEGSYLFGLDGDSASKKVKGRAMRPKVKESA